LNGFVDLSNIFSTAGKVVRASGILKKKSEVPRIISTTARPEAASRSSFDLSYCVDDGPVAVFHDPYNLVREGDFVGYAGDMFDFRLEPTDILHGEAGVPQARAGLPAGD
jgi:hypothetical protein